ncbi:hypothetical protein D3C84_369290 [compost metagenome]
MQIERCGTVRFGDASLHVSEDDYPAGSARIEWDKVFKRQVFARIVQQLNRIGWTLEIPAEKVERYGQSFARGYREGRKGNLQCELGVSGRCIELKMWQDVANVKNSNGGRYDFDKEKRMPYLLRLEMERTRRRIRDYLCNVFSGYEFKDSRQLVMGPGLGQVTALEYALHDQKSSGHYQPELGHASFSNDAQDSGDGLVIENGMRVYAQDYTGRIITGNAYYCLNGNWMIVTGRYGAIFNVWHKQVWVNSPGDLRRKRNERTRRKRLEQEMSKAVARMDYRRAEVLRDVLFPKDQALFLIWHKEKDVYFRSNYSGYTSDTVDAGKYTRDELEPYLHGALETDRFKAVEVRAA